MQDLPLNALRAFAVVYASGGVRAAARELGIAHSSVSRHLAELEGWLGVGLTRREGSGGRRMLAFTPQGEALGKAALSGLREIERAATGLREARSANSVALSATPSFAARWLLPRLPLLEKACPRVELSVVVDQRISDLEAAGIDLAVRMGQGPWPDVRCEPLMDEALYPVMSPTLWKDTGRPARLADLARLRLLHDRDPQASWGAWREAYGPESLDTRSGPRFASSDLVLRAAAQGQGVALARHRLAAEDFASGVLVRPMGDVSVPLGVAYWIVLPRHHRVRDATAAVIDWLKEQAEHDGRLL